MNFSAGAQHPLLRSAGQSIRTEDVTGRGSAGPVRAVTRLSVETNSSSLDRVNLTRWARSLTAMQPFESLARWIAIEFIGEFVDCPLDDSRDRTW